ncbi:hypothetical protein Tel_09635 [Candidatus Tenderia electrophaga]|jgi:hypothetical protein|uniref:Sel1 repeat family protein n=1 Tax=Candidatus Tenderia electrophaga TaxID=1748243 RepID=A0A0S2TE08_9GAMM|nr:hypothetical protein Tel_09635 [Candidatus Tenderia electrophaga]
MTLSRKIVSLAIIAATAVFGSSAMAAPLTQQQLNELTRHAQQGDTQAQSDLANRYQAGDGVEQNTAQAAFWYTKLAEKGVAEAQLTLGLMYIRGDGIDRDDEQALHWLNLAAEQRLALAQYLLGIAYAEGHGVPRDRVKAYMWYEIAAAMDHQNAVDARAALAPQLNQQEIINAEKMATEWWMKFHH